MDKPKLIVDKEGKNEIKDEKDLDDNNNIIINK